MTIKRKMILIMGIMVSVIPILLVGILLYFYYSFGIESFFNTRVSEEIANTVKISQLYLEEHKENVKVDALSAANNIERNKIYFLRDPEYLQVFIDQYAIARNLAEVMVFTKDRIIVRNLLGISLLFENIKSDVLQELKNQDVMILKDNSPNRVRAIAKINSFYDDSYVLVGRYIDQDILNHINKTKDSAEEYKLFLGGLQITTDNLKMIFVISSFILLVISILIARKLALYISRPLENIVNATVMLRKGDFSVRLPENMGEDELSTLARAFNVMTERIDTQHSELVDVNRIIDDRRRFIEVILAEVSAGIIVINANHNVILNNKLAADILGDKSDLYGKNINDVLNEIDEYLESIKNQLIEVQVNHMILNRNLRNIHLYVRMGPVLNSKGLIDSIVITFNDISELISNQKAAAWADVAKRIAHEIKNPLTPIYLAAERLKKKYLEEISSDRAIFEKYIDTIMNQVGIIERMVKEFIDLARIPSLQIKKNDMLAIANECITLQKIVNPDISYSLNNIANSRYVDCDYDQISRVLTNLLLNAADAIKLKYHNDIKYGKIAIVLSEDKKTGRMDVKVIDNGIGIDIKIIDAVLEPYVTTKNHGMGIGLSIVKKIIEDHGGTLLIMNNEEVGVEASFKLNISRD